MRTWFKQQLFYPWGAWSEIILITGLTLLASIYFRPADPLFLQAAFPLPWLGPVLVALRYGVGLGICSALMLILGFRFLVDLSDIPLEVYRFNMAGGSFLTLCVGQFASSYLLQLRRRQRQQYYAEDQLDKLSRLYYMTRISHDRLEQSMVSKPITLRGALGQLTEIMVKSEKALNIDNAERFMQLLKNCCSLDKAALYLIKEKKLQLTALATIGDAHINLRKHDVLITQCLEHNLTSYHSINQLSTEQRSDYLAVVPLVNSQKQALGVVTISDIAFWALNDTTLETISVLMAFFADEVSAINTADPLLGYYPKCPPRFAQELLRLVHLKKQYDMDSAIAALIVKPDKIRETLLQAIQKLRRGTDQLWIKPHGEDIMVMTLMPFVGSAAISGYIRRISAWLKSEFGICLGQDICYIRYLSLFPTENIKEVLDVLFARLEEHD